MKLSLITIALLASTSALAEQQIDTKEQEKKVQQSVMEHIQIIGRSDTLSTESGSATLIDELELEKFEYDDIHRVLANVPGVNIRQEDGYGLRPNIGFRGVTPERSKKITILEDGILIGPAPYSAPAAYYFPSVTRMTSVEVFKGPSAIKFGPNTVAGTLNMTSRAVPEELMTQVELAFGANNYQKTHGVLGNAFSIGSGNQIGWLIEGLSHKADGFKDIDNKENSLYDTDSGFVKNDLLFKFNYQFGGNLLGLHFDQLLEVKVSQSNEDSNETYLGLTDSDFKQTPYRRYAASQVGNMDWTHQQQLMTYHASSDLFNITTRVYNNEFTRAWRKVNGFNPTNNQATDRSLQEIMAHPDDGINSEYYQLLTGQIDSTALHHQFVVGTNDRSYFSKGWQTDINFGLELFSVKHAVTTGIRFHEDQIDRDHYQQNYRMLSGVMTPNSQGVQYTTTNMENSDTRSIYIEDTMSINDFQLTLGARNEYSDSRYQNRVAGKEDDWLTKQTSVWLYSASAFYTINPTMGVFAGVHQGYVPTGPKQSPAIKPEQSVNYELGGRYKNNGTKFELVGFFNDFNNLKESCSFSTSASCVNQGLVDQEYNGGEVDVYGLEASIQHRFSYNDAIELPVAVTYTNTQSEFKTTFNSSFELWGDITAGDPVPYLPEQQLTLNLGIAGQNWQVNLLIKYLGQMHEAAGDNVALSGSQTDEYTVVDLSFNYFMDDLGEIYLKADNITDEIAMVSRRPFGARPSKPQQLFLGYKYRF